MNHTFFTDIGGKRAAYALLTHAYRAVYGDELPKIEKTASGKPYFPQRSDVHFSLSHGKNHALVTLGDSPCGCDIEHERTVRPETVSRFTDCDELASLPFLHLWTLKEGYIKLKDDPTLEIKDIRFTVKNDIISAPDVNAFSAVFREKGAYIAVLCLGEKPAAPIFVPSAQLSLEIL